jgi:4-hydroxy-tetrahydrodipicolinate synthase
VRSFGNMLTAMVTPLDKNLAVDYPKAKLLAKWLVDTGSDGIVVAGTTGESPNLTVDEKLKLYEAVLDAVGDRAVVVAGTGSNSTAQSVELTQKAEKIGVQGIMLVGPYYNKPPQEGLYQHFRTIAEATSLPVMVYNVPGRTSSNILPATILRLAQVPNIRAVKEASGNVDQTSEIARGAGDRLQIFSGDDSLTLPIMAAGGVGIVSVAAHVAGKMIKEMVMSFLAGDTVKATALHLKLYPLFKGIFITTNPIPIKTALRLIGMDVGGLRLPLVTTTRAEEDSIAGILKELALL